MPEVCIALQDEYGTDINVLLLFLWTATRRRRAPATADIARADAAVRDRRTRVVEPNRGPSQDEIANLISVHLQNNFNFGMVQNHTTG